MRYLYISITHEGWPDMEWMVGWLHNPCSQSMFTTVIDLKGGNHTTLTDKAPLTTYMTVVYGYDRVALVLNDHFHYKWGICIFPLHKRVAWYGMNGWLTYIIHVHNPISQQLLTLKGVIILPSLIRPHWQLTWQ